MIMFTTGLHVLRVEMKYPVKDENFPLAFPMDTICSIPLLDVHLGGDGFEVTFCENSFKRKVLTECCVSFRT
jgi:hypothetical protein